MVGMNKVKQGQSKTDALPTSRDVNLGRLFLCYRLLAGFELLRPLIEVGGPRVIVLDGCQEGGDRIDELVQCGGCSRV